MEFNIRIQNNDELMELILLTQKIYQHVYLI